MPFQEGKLRRLDLGKDENRVKSFLGPSIVQTMERELLIVNLQEER